jgi:hypothetical protein
LGKPEPEMEFIEMSSKAGGVDGDEEKVCWFSEISETAPSFVQNIDYCENERCRHDWKLT